MSACEATSDTVKEKIDRCSQSHRHVPYNLLKRHHSRLCEALHTAPDVALQSLTGRLYSEGIIDGHTKAEVLRHPGYKGANMLMDSVDLYIQRDPQIGDTVLNIMSDQHCLQDIVEEINSQRKSSQVEESVLDTSPVSSDTALQSYKTEEEVVKNAKALKAKFKVLLDKLLAFLKPVAIDRIQVQLSLLLDEEVELLPKEIDEILDKVDEKTNHGGIIGYLVRRKLLGYLNHRLLDAFKDIIDNEQWNILVEDYKAARNDLLKSTDLKTLARVFHNHPSLAPKVPQGIPTFIIHLDSLWDNSTYYRWNELLEKQVNWPSFIYIDEINDNCIIIEYGVLPFFAPAVVRDLTDPQIISILEEQGITKIDLSDELNMDRLHEELEHDNQSVDSQQQSLPLDDSDLLQGDSLSDEKQIIISSNEDQSITEDQSTDTKHTQQQKEKELQKSAKEKSVRLLKFVQHGADTAAISRLLQEGADIHATDGDGNTPLHRAVTRGKVKTVKLLLNKGASIDIKNKERYGYTPLHFAVQHGHDSIIKILVQYGANVDEGDEYGETPLHYAARYGKKTTVELLLKYKADYSIQSKYGDTILHSAAEGGNTEIVKLFLELCGTSDLHKVGKYGYTPLHCAVDKNHTEMVKLLIKSGANVDRMKECHLTPLHVAADKNHVDITNFLLKAGANVHSKDKDGRTPLHHAAKEGHWRIVDLLQKSEANINEKDEQGFTPLHYAVRVKGFRSYSREATVKMLLSKGAKVDQQDHKGHTPLHYAEQDNLSEIVQMLSNLSCEQPDIPDPPDIPDQPDTHVPHDQQLDIPDLPAAQSTKKTPSRPPIQLNPVFDSPHPQSHTSSIHMAPLHEEVKGLRSLEIPQETTAGDTSEKRNEQTLSTTSGNTEVQLDGEEGRCRQM